MRGLLLTLVEAGVFDLIMLAWVLMLVIFILLRKIIRDSRQPEDAAGAEDAEPAEDAREPA